MFKPLQLISLIFFILVAASTITLILGTQANVPVRQDKYYNWRTFGNLGLVCVCCDNEKRSGECRSTSELRTCSAGKLQCNPWKHH
ncbi:hypothetical protein M9H77_10944 [Catharanthus roseus]|uniref:Uncharacterized protein n=1 Tax=Catharanthus roseus TaxID=4058 RepID=A0ACC0BD30_CATRO|nr:hypothetical protein M9H77_10944 [Catharanthus roseus]